MSKQRFTYGCLQSFISESDHVSLHHVLRWEYNKAQYFELKNDEGLTLVHQACLDGQLKCLDVLLQHGASPHVKSSVGWTPLHAATLGGSFEVVCYLLCDCSADSLVKDEMNCLPSDLTMDNNILEVLNKYQKQQTLRHQLDRSRSLLCASTLPRRRRARTHIPNETNGLNRNRPQSMFAGESEAMKIRTNLASDLSSHLKSMDDNKLRSQVKTLATRHLSHDLGSHSNCTKTSYNRERSRDSKEEHNNQVIRRYSMSSCPTAPRVYKVVISKSHDQKRSVATTNKSPDEHLIPGKNETVESHNSRVSASTSYRELKSPSYVESNSPNYIDSKSPRYQNSRSPRYRDSGVFEEDIGELDLCDEFTFNFNIKPRLQSTPPTKEQEIEHYSLV